MRYSIRTVTPLAQISPVISAAEAKDWLRVTNTSEDDLIEATLRSSQDWVERFTNRVLTQRVLEMSLSAFPALPELISLPRDPVTGIISVTYTDADGIDVNLSGGDYRWSEDVPDLLKPPLRSSWPNALAEEGSVRVRFEAGYEEGLCPPSLLTAVKMLTAHHFQNREAVSAAGGATEMPLGIAALLRPYRRVSI